MNSNRNGEQLRPDRLGVRDALWAVSFVACVLLGLYIASRLLDIEDGERLSLDGILRLLLAGLAVCVALACVCATSRTPVVTPEFASPDAAARPLSTICHAHVFSPNPAKFAAIVDSMCMTVRHDFGLDAAVDDIGSGMRPGERDALRSQMRRLLDHHGRAIADLYQPLG